MALFYDIGGIEETSQPLTQEVLPVSARTVNEGGFIYIPEDIAIKSERQLSQNIIHLSSIKENFKGFVQQEKSFQSDIGEPHPFGMNMSELQGVYVNVGFIEGIVDKYIDFIISPGFYIQSEDKRAKVLIEQFVRDHKFDDLLRTWIRDALICGNGYIELAKDKSGLIKKLKVLDPKTMFIKRDNKGRIIKYIQYFGRTASLGSDLPDKVEFEPDEIAHYAHNKIGDNAYGIGIVFPGLGLIDNILKAQKDMHKILSRKANTQIHVKMGDASTGRMPSAASITSFGNRMQYMNEKTEWVTDANVDMKVLDFGNIGDKFESVLNMDFDMLFFTFQVPEVLMGRGNIAEGLADVQLKAFQRRIQSIQAEIENIIENEIFKKYLISQTIDSWVELEWGEQNDQDRREEVTVLTTLLQNPLINAQLRSDAENRLALLLNLRDIESPEIEKEEEMDEKQPKTPWDNTTENFSLDKGVLDFNDELNNLTVQEWVNFKYDDYSDHIISYINSQDFSNLQASNQRELDDGYLTPKQTTKFKKILKKGVQYNLTMRQMMIMVKDEVKPGELRIIVEPSKDDEGNVVRAGYERFVKEEPRIENMVRTETTKSISEGSLDYYKKNNVERVKFNAAGGGRTCPICLELDGTVYEVADASGVIPIHPACRCLFSAVILE